MKKITVVYQTTMFYEEEVEVPDDFDINNDIHYQEMMDQLSYSNEYDMDTEVMDILVEEQ